jgi:hypothetical protein
VNHFSENWKAAGHRQIISLSIEESKITAGGPQVMRGPERMSELFADAH